MAKESNYRTAQKLFLAGHIKSLADLLDAVDQTPLAKDIHTAPSRLKKLIETPALFTFQDCYNIADLLGVDRKLMVDLVYQESIPSKKARKSK
jgi:hypothetical protein